MNRRMVLNVIGKLVLSEALLMLLPLSVSVYYGEFKVLFSFLVAITVAAILGSVLVFLVKPRNYIIYAKEGFIIVAASWILMSVIGALPFYISGEIKNYFDAFFETVSGFTTTGASILTNVEALSRGLLFWRSFTHWIGGMGIIVFVMAVLPNTTDRSIHIMRAEVPGPIVGKLVPRIKDTAKILYTIYIVLTIIEIVFLFFGNMPFFDAVVHAFGTAGTGGFGIKADSIASYSPYIQWVITAFMLVFGVNFNIYYLVLLKRIKAIIKSAELWTYLFVVLFSIAFISANVYAMYQNLSATIRHSAFQVASIITTTGYSTVDFNQWPEFSKTILLILMFIGGCAGSTAGGLKVSRLIILFKQLKNEIKRMLHPRSVNVVKFEEKSVDNATLSGVNTYFFTYIVFFCLILLVISVDKFDFTTNFTATAACFNNVGPGLGAIVGPAGSYAQYSNLSKVVLSIAMLLGRLEIFPILLAFSPSTWTKK